MTSSVPVPRLAVLIDGENISHKLAARIFTLIGPLGDASVRIVYGDFSGPASSWAEAAARHAIKARHVFPAAKGKNSADIALTIDAMDLLRDGAIDSFCIVSSDGDYAELAGRIRAQKRDAYGFGSRTTVARCRWAYTQFFLLEADATVATTPPARAPLSGEDLSAIRRAVDESPQLDGWHHLAQFGSHARKKGLTPQAFGVATFGKLLAATGQYQIEKDQRFRPRPKMRLVGASQ